MNDLRQSAWITGVGAVSSIGASFAEIAENLFAGRSGIRRVESFYVDEHPCQLAGQVGAVPCPAEIPIKTFADYLPMEQGIAWIVCQALRDAGLWDRRSSPRVGVILGIGAEWSQTWAADADRGGERVWRPELDRRSALAHVAQDLDIIGPTLSVSGACASGNHAFALGREWLAMGLVDVCLAGACDVGISAYSLAGFGNLRALSRRNDAPGQALRPFDRQRDGMVLGEGGAMFVLERGDDARRRHAKVYAEVAGCGARSDAYHMVIPAADPIAATRAVNQALADAEVEPSQIDYINAHATGTPVGDACEARAVLQALGPSARHTPISSTKSMTGHLLSAAAAFEALACLAAMRHGVLPPTLNLDDIDPACDGLCHVPNVAREKRVRVAVSNSFGFGGNNTSLVLRAVA